MGEPSGSGCINLLRNICPCKPGPVKQVQQAVRTNCMEVHPISVITPDEIVPGKKRTSVLPSYYKCPFGRGQIIRTILVIASCILLRCIIWRFFVGSRRKCLQQAAFIVTDNAGYPVMVSLVGGKVPKKVSSAVKIGTIEG
ncbi:hypothetical protein [Prevotella jejuni]|uniref:hypothetical protein n=1 Tax=Prevotella jejuni TaxID=1177574 RepID=UPI002011EBB2|nr:hypothetical protein [Prevotella jejuni]